MAIILNLETATTNCSVSIARNGETLALVEENGIRYSHAEQLHNFIAESLKEAEVSLDQLDAVAVSKGPGSYTGLRIGISAAKGLCFALDIPLISVNTLKILATTIETDGGSIIPLLDARRMEVYAAVYDSEYKEIEPAWAEIVTPDSFKEVVKTKKAYLVGPGAEKCRDVLSSENFIFETQRIPSAREMARLSYEKFKGEKFENNAYFEPFYLKDFITTKPK